uniref:Putative type II intron maturase n=1 Tax=Ostreobium quekettii TaxID=121088 RepID=A0A650BXP4_9CHLO|nr:putative type II intron maturase [Ostreobium quekettii]QGQ61979.1 putative type II intron maturase [Ostreobium quekettii]
MAKRLREGNYECKPARRVVIPKCPNPSRFEKAPSYKIPISIVSPRDQIVQEVVFIILSYIYGGSFYKGFRRSSGCHSALKDIRRRWNGVSWFIEFDIRPRNEKISRRILVNILREDIQDQRFFNLLHKMFKTNLVNLFPSNKAPLGLSRLLCDIYLSKLDKEVKRIQVEYNSSHRACRENPVFTQFTRVTLAEKIRLEFNRYKIRRLLHKRIRRAYKKGISKTYYNNPNDRRIFYVRYIDHFLFGVIGSKLLVKKVQNRVSQFLKSGLHFEVNKTTITHSTAGMVHFLGMKVQCTLPPKYSALRRGSESLKRIRLRLKTQLLLRKKAWEASIRRIAFHKWAEAFEKTRKLLGSTTLAKRVAFSNAFELAQRLTTNNLLGPQIGGSTVSQLLTAEKALFSSIIWKGLPQEIKRKHVEFISLLDHHSYGYNRLKMSTLSGTRSGCTASSSSTKSLPPRIRILAPIDHIRDQLRRRGIVEDKNFRPTASKRMLNHEDSIIVNYFRVIAQGLLSYYRCCDNFHKVKRIATYHLRWAALHTLANKHKLTVKNAIYCYTLNLVIRQEFNGQVIIVAKFPSKKDIAIMRKKFLVDADLPRYSAPFASSVSELRRKYSDQSIYAD